MVEDRSATGRRWRRAKPAPVHIPQHVDDLDAAWFTETLSSGQGGPLVVAVDTEQVGEGIGFIGELQRCRLTWDRPSAEAPASVIVKIPTSHVANRALGEGLGGYQREIEVYAKLGDRLGLPMPRYHHGVMDPDPAPWVTEVLIWLLEKLPVRGVQWLTDRFLAMAEKSRRRYLLMIEDIHDARPPTQVAGGTLDDAKASLEVLARFHAANWMCDGAPGGVENIRPINRVPKVFQASYRRNRDLFVERFGAVVGDEMIARLDEAQESMPALMDQLAAAPWTLLHGDFRLDNVLFRASGEIVVLDFQLLGLGRPGADVAYFITTALSPDHRADEVTLLRGYHEALRDAGISDYSYDDLVKDTTIMKTVLAHRMVGTGDVLDTSILGSDATFLELMAQRTLGWLEPAATA